MIKISRTTDYGVLSKLNEEIQTFHHKIQPNIFKPYNIEAVSNFFKTTLMDENAVAYVAEVDEEAIGYILLFKIHIPDNPFQYSRRFVLIDQILVLNSFQGKGIGKLLLNTALTFAKENNFQSIELNHWTLNESARLFFNQNNFEYYNEKMWRVIE